MILKKIVGKIIMIESKGLKESENTFEDERVNEEEIIFKEILETNERRFECEQSGDYLEAGRLKLFLEELGSLYKAKCLSNLNEYQK